MFDLYVKKSIEEILFSQEVNEKFDQDINSIFDSFKEENSVEITKLFNDSISKSNEIEAEHLAGLTEIAEKYDKELWDLGMDIDLGIYF